jgi:hypothetical protein
MPLAVKAVRLRRCQTARSSRTTIAALVSKSVTPMAGHRIPSWPHPVLNDLAVRQPATAATTAGG